MPTIGEQEHCITDRAATGHQADPKAHILLITEAIPALGSNLQSGFVCVPSCHRSVQRTVYRVQGTTIDAHTHNATYDDVCTTQMLGGRGGGGRWAGSLRRRVGSCSQT